MTKSSLLPCPFCGYPPEIGSLCGDEENWLIWCKNCQQAMSETGVSGKTKEDIIKAWNRRSYDQK